MSAARVPIGSTGGEPKGDDVMDELLGVGSGAPAKGARGKAPAAAGTGGGESSTRKRMTVYVETEIQEKLRAAAYWTRENISDLMEQAALDMIRKLEREHNEGKPFETPPERPKRGRPIRR